MPILALAYMMANRERLAVYLDDVFQTAFDDVFADKLLQKGTVVRLRHIDRSVREAAFLTGLAQSLDIHEEGSALEVAKALYQRFEALPNFSRRSALVSNDAQLVRSVILKGRDPEALLFEDLPDALGDRLSSEVVMSSLAECENLYPRLREEITIALARVLGTDPENFAGLSARVQSIKGLTNDLTFDAFAGRAEGFEGKERDVEGLASVLVHKPLMNWSDRDREQAFTQLANFGRRFRELEAVAVVRQRKSSTEAVALVVGVDPNILPVVQSFELTEAEKLEASRLAENVLSGLRSTGGTEQLQLAALARAVAALSGEITSEREAEAA
jgi:hypothetical protein